VLGFPVVEILKPQGFKERSASWRRATEERAMMEFLAGDKLPGIVALEK